MLGLIGRKCGMSRLVEDDGIFVPVTIVEILENFVTQIKTMERDGYTAVQLAASPQKAFRMTKPLLGHFAKASVPPCSVLVEFHVEHPQDYHLAQQIDMPYQLKDCVDVVGISKGKGFAGVVKRHGFRLQGASHGVTKSHRGPGSTGGCQDPGRIQKGKKMAGHMGVRQVTAQNLPIVKIDDRFLAIKGAVPGPAGSIVLINPTVKGTIK